MLQFAVSFQKHSFPIVYKCECTSRQVALLSSVSPFPRQNSAAAAAAGGANV
jgi:hypothetical protein